jgi:hypothetical protein
MTGMDLKKKLEELGFSKVFIANKMGTIPQNVNTWFQAGDVKTGTIEKLSEVLNIPISVFYGEAFSKVSNITGNNNTTATGNNNTVSGSDDRLLALLLNKDEQLLLAMKQTSKAQEQTDVVLKMLTEK